MRGHHTKIHGESIAKYTYNCEECGEEKTIPEAWARNTSTKYCSRECKNNAATLERPPERDCASDECDNTFTPDPWRTDAKFCSPGCVYESRSIGEVNKIEKTCEQCRSEFSVWPGKAQRRRTCSRECLSKWQSENRSGKNNPVWSRVEVHCHWCGETKHVTESRFDRVDNHFCGQDCFEKWISATDTNEGSNSSSWKEYPELTCKHCGRKYQVLPHREDKSEFCSQKCFRDHHTGQNHSCWEGGEVDYGKGWHEQKRESVRERYNRTCQGCGELESDHIENTGDRLHVHHIIPARTFDDPLKRNAVGNLIPLCQSCHLGKWEGIPLRPQLVE